MPATGEGAGEVSPTGQSAGGLHANASDKAKKKILFVSC